MRHGTASFFLTLLLTSALVSAADARNHVCGDYATVTGTLQQRYQEEKLFSGFVGGGASAPSSAVYEVWVNPSNRSWSLLLITPHVASTASAAGRAYQCVSVAEAGIGYRLSESWPDSAAIPAAADADGIPPGCFTHRYLARQLQQNHEETLLLRAFVNSTSALEFYAGRQSWTLARVQLIDIAAPRGVAAHPLPANASPAICAVPRLAGLQWSLYAARPRSF